MVKKDEQFKEDSKIKAIENVGAKIAEDLKTKSIEDSKIERVLVENFVSLQKVMTNLAVKFEGLSSQISKLLELFEISAKTIAEKEYSLGESKTNSQLVEKVDNLMEQNKIIAKGISLLHEKENSYQSNNFPLVKSSFSNIQPRGPQQSPQNKENNDKARIVSIDSSEHSRIRNTEI